MSVLIPTQPSRQRRIPGSGNHRAVGGGIPAGQHVLEHEVRIGDGADEALHHREVDDHVGRAARAARHAVSAAAAAKVPAVYSWIRATDLDGRLVRDAVARHPRAVGLHDEPARRRSDVGAGLAVVRDAHDGEARVGGMQHVGREADRLEGTGPEALDDHIGPGRGVEQPARAVGGLEIDDRAPLPAVQVPEQPAAAVGIRPRHRRDRTPRAKRIAAGRLDLADVGADLAEELRRVRRRDLAAELEDAEPVQRRHRRSVGRRSPRVASRPRREPRTCAAMVEQPRSDEIEDLGPASVACRDDTT